LRSLYLNILIFCYLPYYAIAENININVVDNANKALPDMVVYLQPEDDISLPFNEQIVEVGQFDRSFTPYISVMQLGNKVIFKNKDDITHHIYSPIGDNKFSFKISAGESQIKRDFQQTGEVAMGCNIHDWMSGYLLIVDTPLFGKTNENGMLDLPMPPAGKYQLIVWHPQLDATNNRVYQSIDLSEQKQVTIKIDNKILKISEQKNQEDFDFLSDY
jgi:plastocyanin|tara:strand:+ start:14346 stop:14996 length:651 start_codon:yes stop_codon:yes gene_type:complete